MNARIRPHPGVSPLELQCPKEAALQDSSGASAPSLIIAMRHPPEPVDFQRSQTPPMGIKTRCPQEKKRREILRPPFKTQF